jgi:hypothetical protein
VVLAFVVVVAEVVEVVVFVVGFEEEDVVPHFVEVGEVAVLYVLHFVVVDVEELAFVIVVFGEAADIVYVPHLSHYAIFVEVV